jgi:hypothetical protein
VQLEGLTVQKKSSAILQFIAFYSEDGKQDPLFITNYVTINVLDVLSRTRASARRPVRQAELLDAHLVRHQRLVSLKSDAGRHHRGDPGAERAGAGRPHRRAPDRQRPAVPVQRADAGPADDAGAVRRIVHARQSGRLGAARARRRAGRARRAEPGQRGRLNGQPAVPIGIYLAPGANAVQTGRACRQTLDR